MRRLFMLSLWLSGALFSASAGNLAQEKGGLRANYSKIVVDNLPIGSEVSMEKLVNLPLKVGSRFTIPIEVLITVRSPAKAREGYEPIPDTNWVKTGAALLNVPPSGEGQTDVVLYIPDDESLLGRRFQADVIVKTLGDKNFKGVHTGYEITGCLLFSVAPVRNEQALQQALANPADGAFRLDPPRVDLFDISPGQEVVVTAPQGAPLRLINESTRACPYFLEAIPAEKSSYRPDPGSRLGSPEDLRLGTQEFELEPGMSTNLTLSIQVPANADLKAAPYLYQVAVRSGKTRALEHYLKVYLWGKPAPETPVF